MRTHLVIPDAHDQPEINKKRFVALGKFIDQLRPDVIVCMGDFASFDSLSSYDKGKKSHEGRRYQKDITSANTALDLVERGIPHGRYKPRKIFCKGNHEFRIDRAVESNAELDGTMSSADVQFKEHGWETHDFLDIVPVDDIHYSHYFVSGVMSRPIGGESPAASILKKHFVSAVAAHSHLYDFSERTRADGKKINGLIAGCYCDHDMAYATASQSFWYAGLSVLEDVNKGDYDLRRISLKRILKEYL